MLVWHFQMLVLLCLSKRTLLFFSGSPFFKNLQTRNLSPFRVLWNIKCQVGINRLWWRKLENENKKLLTKNNIFENKCLAMYNFWGNLRCLTVFHSNLLATFAQGHLIPMHLNLIFYIVYCGTLVGTIPSTHQFRPNLT